MRRLPCRAAGHSTPQRSRVPSRDPSADLARQRSADRSRALHSDPRERGAAVRSTERLNRAAAVHTAASPAFPPRDQRAASPGRALLEVQQRLQQYAGKQSVGDGWGGGGAGAIQASPSWREAQAQQRPRVPATGDTYADASAEIADIDGRLQSLQNFLRAAKAGQAVAAPV